MNAAELAYFRELAADIAANGGMEGKTVLQAIQEAHERRQNFAKEMIENRTERAQMARKVLCAQVYGQAVLRGAHDQAIQHCEHIASATWRKAMGMQ